MIDVKPSSAYRLTFFHTFNTEPQVVSTSVQPRRSSSSSCSIVQKASCVSSDGRPTSRLPESRLPPPSGNGGMPSAFVYGVLAQERKIQSGLVRSDQLARAVAECLDHLRPWMPWAHDEPKPLDEKMELLRTFRGRFDLGEDFVHERGVGPARQGGLLGLAHLRGGHHLHCLGDLRGVADRLDAPS